MVRSEPTTTCNKKKPVEDFIFAHFIHNGRLTRRRHTRRRRRFSHFSLFPGRSIQNAKNRLNLESRRRRASGSDLRTLCESCECVIWVLFVCAASRGKKDKNSTSGSGDRLPATEEEKKLLFMYVVFCSSPVTTTTTIVTCCSTTATGTAYPTTQTGYAVATAATPAPGTGYEQAYQTAATPGTYASEYTEVIAPR